MMTNLPPVPLGRRNKDRAWNRSWEAWLRVIPTKKRVDMTWSRGYWKTVFNSWHAENTSMHPEQNKRNNIILQLVANITHGIIRTYTACYKQIYKNNCNFNYWWHINKMNFKIYFIHEHLNFEIKFKNNNNSKVNQINYGVVKNKLF